MLNANSIPQNNYAYAPNSDESMEVDESWSKSFRIDFGPYRIYPEQLGISQAAGGSRELDRALKHQQFQHRQLIAKAGNIAVLMALSSINQNDIEEILK